MFILLWPTRLFAVASLSSLPISLLWSVTKLVKDLDMLLPIPDVSAKAAPKPAQG
ncbi:MAG: hypothetical protein PV345_00630 [Wolbachia sp.]|nr:hypothetical protein [Wolbachia sp.]